MKNNWQIKKIKDIAKVVSGSTPKTSVPQYWNGDINWLTPKDLSKYNGVYISESGRKITNAGLESCSTTIVPANSVMISSRAPIGYVTINTVPMCTNQGMKSLILNQNIDAKYVYYFLIASKRELESRGSGTTFKEISKSKLEDVDIPVMRFDNQVQLVQKLDSLFSKIDAGEEGLKQVQQQLEVYRQAVLKKAFEGRKNWNEYKWDQVVGKIIGGGTPSKKEPNFWHGDIPWASVKDVKSWTISKTQDYITNEGLEKSATNLIPENRIVIVTRISLGKGFITSFPVTINQDLKALELNEELINMKFFKWWYISNEKEIQNMGRGTTVKGIRLEDLKNLKVFCPNLEHQAEIVSYIETEMSKIEYIGNQIIKIKKLSPALRQSILKKVFNGELI